MYIMLVLLIGFGILGLQLYICFKAKKTLTRLIPSGVFALVFGIFCVFYRMASGWDALGWFVLALYALVAFVICVVGLLIYFVIQKIKNNKHL